MFRTRLARRFQSTVTYNRKGDQPDVAPAVVKQVSKTAQGVTVITADNYSPVSTVAVYLSQGVRADTPVYQGVAHVFKRSLIRVSSFFI
jgi:predicted Zn-dependent peptidase